MNRFTKFLPLLIILVLFSTYIACGDAPVASLLGPSATLAPPVKGSPTLNSEVSTRNSFTIPDGPNSCPDAAYPKDLQINVKESRVAITILWRPEPNIRNYQFSIEKYALGNIFRPLVVFVDEAQGEKNVEGGPGMLFYLDWRLDAPDGGRYRVKIRTRNACQRFGPWSPGVEFEEGYDTGHDIVEVIPPPIIDPTTGLPLPPVPPPPVPPSVPPGPPAPSSYALGSNIEPFAILAGSAITCTTSTVTGDIGVSPESSITGFPGLCTIFGTIRSTAFSATAKADLATAYDLLNGLPCSPISANLNGAILDPGVYCVGALASNLSGTLTLRGAGGHTLRFSSTFITSSGSNISHIGGAVCGGTNYVVASSATLEGISTGNVLAFSSITMNPGAVHTGRMLARNAAVTLTTAVLTNTGCN